MSTRENTIAEMFRNVPGEEAVTTVDKILNKLDKEHTIEVLLGWSQSSTIKK